MSSYSTINTWILTKKNNDSEKVKDEERRGRDCIFLNESHFS